MNCPHCEYLLFNLTQPVCPECGREFDVEQYRFAPGAVTFHCPHCDQAYYGNDQQGLPSPREFACAQCQNPVTLRDLRVVPSTPEVRGGRIDVSPWDERLKIGRARAWWRTTGLALRQPVAFFHLTRRTPIMGAWGFAAISMYVGFLPKLLLIFGLFGLLIGGGPGLLGGALPPMGSGWLALLGLGVIPLIGLVPLVFAGVFAVAIHFGLVLCAPNRQPLGATFRTVLLALAPYCFYSVPCVGSTTAAVWFLVLAVHGVRVVHGVDGWRAAGVVLWLPLLYLGLIVAGLALDIIAM